MLSKCDIMTVGECPKVTPDQVGLYTAEERNELNMVFQFEHMSFDKQKGHEPFLIHIFRFNILIILNGRELDFWSSQFPLLDKYKECPL